METPTQDLTNAGKPSIPPAAVKAGKTATIAEGYKSFYEEAKRLGARFQPANNKGCNVTGWPLANTPSLTTEQALKRLAARKAVAVIWPKDLPARAVCFDVDDREGARAFKSWELPDTTSDNSTGSDTYRKHYWYVLPAGHNLKLPNIISETAMENAGFGQIGVFFTCKVIIGPGSWSKGKQRVLDDEDLPIEFAVLPREFLFSLSQLVKPTDDNDAELIPVQPAGPDDKHDLLVIHAAAKKQKIDLITGNSDFLRFAYCAVWAAGAEMAVQLCLSYGGKTEDVPKRVQNIAKCPPRARQLGNMIDLAKQKGVRIPWGSLKTQVPSATMSVKTVDIENVEEIDSKPLVELKAEDGSVAWASPPRGTTMGLCAPTGSMKTILALTLIKEAAKVYPKSVSFYISNDMPIEQVKTYAKKHGITDDIAKIFDFHGWLEADYEEVCMAIKMAANGRVVNLIIADTLTEFCCQAYKSVGVRTEFDSNNRTTAIHSNSKILNPLAKRFNAVLIGLENTPKGKDTRDTYPGSAKWEGGFTGACSRIYTLRRTQQGKVPKDIANILNQQGEEWAYVASIKDRFNDDPDFVFRMIKGELEYRRASEVAKELVNAQPLVGKQPLPLGEVEYHEQLEQLLAENPNTLFGHDKLVRMGLANIGLAKHKDHIYAKALMLPLNAIIQKGGAVEMPPDAVVPYGLFYNDYKGKHRQVCYIPPPEPPTEEANTPADPAPTTDTHIDGGEETSISKGEAIDIRNDLRRHKKPEVIAAERSLSVSDVNQIKCAMEDDGETITSQDE